MELTSIHIQISRSCARSFLIWKLASPFTHRVACLALGSRDSCERHGKHTSGFNFSVRFQENGKFNLPPIYGEQNPRGETTSFLKKTFLLQGVCKFSITFSATFGAIGVRWRKEDVREATKFQSKLKFDTNLFLDSTPCSHSRAKPNSHIVCAYKIGLRENFQQSCWRKIDFGLSLLLLPPAKNWIEISGCCC